MSGLPALDGDEALADGIVGAAGDPELDDADGIEAEEGIEEEELEDGIEGEELDDELDEGEDGIDGEEEDEGDEGEGIDGEGMLAELELWLWLED